MGSRYGRCGFGTLDSLPRQIDNECSVRLATDQALHNGLIVSTPFSLHPRRILVLHQRYKEPQQCGVSLDPRQPMYSQIRSVVPQICVQSGGPWYRVELCKINARRRWKQENQRCVPWEPGSGHGTTSAHADPQIRVVLGQLDLLGDGE